MSAASVLKVLFLKSPRLTRSPGRVSAALRCPLPPTMSRSSRAAGSGPVSLTALEILTILITNPSPERSAPFTSRRAASSLVLRSKRFSVHQPPPRQPLGPAPSLAACLCLQCPATASLTKPASRLVTSCSRSVG